jgi:hypothetical protein
VGSKSGSSAFCSGLMFFVADRRGLLLLATSVGIVSSSLASSSRCSWALVFFFFALFRGVGFLFDRSFEGVVDATFSRCGVAGLDVGGACAGDSCPNWLRGSLRGFFLRAILLVNSQDLLLKC